MRALTSKEQLLEKKKLILWLVRSHPEITRSQIKQLTGISMEMVLKYITELIDAGLIYNSGTSSNHVGRRATFLRINPSGCYFLGVTYNAVTVSGAVIDFAGECVHKYTKALTVPVTRDIVLTEILSCCDSLMAKLGDRAGRLRSISVGGSGYIDNHTGICRKYSRVPDFENVNIKQLLESHYSLPVYVEHIIKATAIQYRLLPGNEKLDDFIYFYAGQGVGMAIVANGCVIDGVSNGAGEIGHLFYRDNGKRCVCGRDGCYETEIGGEAVRSAISALRFKGKLTAVDPDAPDYLSQLVKAGQNGDRDAENLIEHQARITAILLSSTVAVTNPKRIVLSGELTLSNVYTNIIKSVLQRNCLGESVKNLEYDVVRYSNEQLCICAAMNGFYREFSAQ